MQLINNITQKNNKTKSVFIAIFVIVLISVVLLVIGNSITALSVLCLLSIVSVLMTIMLKHAEHYAYYLLIPLVPFSQSIPIISLGSRSINLGMDTIFITILILWHMFTSKRRINILSKSDRISFILTCWLIWNFFTICISSLYLTFNQTAENFIVLLRWGQYVPIFIILANGKLNYDQSKKAILILCISGVMAAALGFYQIFDGLNPLYFKGAPSFTVPLFRESDPGELLDESGFYMGSANYNVVGAYLIISILLSVSYFIPSNKRYVKILGVLAVLIMIGGVIITFSRSSFIALILSLLFFMYKYSKKRFIYTLLILSCVLISSFLVFRNFPLIADLIETVLNIFDVVPRVLAGEQWSASSDVSSQVYGAASRIVGIRDSFYIFWHSPVFGYGFNAYQFFGLKNTPDNYFLQSLAETGVIGFALLVLFFIKTLQSFLSNKFLDSDNFIRNYRIGMSAVISAMLLVNFSSGIFYVQKVWGTFLIFIAIWHSVRKLRLLETVKEI